MRICICTTPIRPYPTNFPPFGSLAIIQALRRIGEEVWFYNIDYFRPKHDQLAGYFAGNQFDVVGISAVVSTAYAYTKYLAGLIRSVSRNTAIVVGGNLAASAEILLRKCQVDFCVVGDGELIIQDLIKILYEKPRNYQRLKATKGICFLDEEGRFYFTGYGARPPAGAIEWPDYSILDADGSLPHYVSGDPEMFYGRLSREEMQGKKVATVIMTKGCVARCTFCHRWEKGFRAQPVDQIVEHVKHLRDRYNVGFISIGDENYGSDRKLAWELVARLGEMGMVWRAAGVRARTVDPETLKHWKANGCVAIFYGIESGSQNMLDVMEKNTLVQMNIDALRWTYENGLFTIVQLVIGMPGETDETIRETIEFLKMVTPHLFLDNTFPSSMTSINYAQALPGTPLYEYARQHRFVGKSLDDEEAYLIRISDTDAYSEDHFINYTGLPLLKVLMWRHWMTAEVDAHYLQGTLGGTLLLRQVGSYFVRALIFRLVGRRLGLKRLCVYLGEQLKKDTMRDDDQSGYFNIKPSWFAPLFLNLHTRRWFYPLLAIGVAILSRDSLSQALRLIVEHLRWSVTRRLRPSPSLPDRSLRKLVVIVPTATSSESEDMMIPLRVGR